MPISGERMSACPARCSIGLRRLPAMPPGRSVPQGRCHSGAGRDRWSRRRRTLACPPCGAQMLSGRDMIWGTPPSERAGHAGASGSALVVLSDRQFLSASPWALRTRVALRARRRRRTAARLAGSGQGIEVKDGVAWTAGCGCRQARSSQSEVTTTATSRVACQRVAGAGGSVQNDADEHQHDDEQHEDAARTFDEVCHAPHLGRPPRGYLPWKAPCCAALWTPSWPGRPDGTPAGRL